jgi:hypothetical protein
MTTKAGTGTTNTKGWDRQYLLRAGDGPEGIEIYTSDEEGVVDWSQAFPALYLTASMNGVMVKLGPFSMPEVWRQVRGQVRVYRVPMPVARARGDYEILEGDDATFAYYYEVRRS